MQVIGNRKNTSAGPPGETTTHLNQVDLSRRWRVSTRTLERWRWLRQGPDYLKLGGRVAYRIEDVEAFEAAGLHVTSKRGPARKVSNR